MFSSVAFCLWFINLLYIFNAYTLKGQSYEKPFFDRIYTYPLIHLSKFLLFISLRFFNGKIDVTFCIFAWLLIKRNPWKMFFFSSCFWHLFSDTMTEYWKSQENWFCKEIDRFCYAKSSKYTQNPWKCFNHFYLG